VCGFIEAESISVELHPLSISLPGPDDLPFVEPSPAAPTGS